MVRVTSSDLCRLNECKVMLDSLKSRREISYMRLSGLLITKVFSYELIDELNSLIWISFAFPAKMMYDARVLHC